MDNPLIYKGCLGSSPHTWGILRSRCSRNCCSRFIPTYVGHTWSGHKLWLPLTVHPHIRGAYFVSSWSRPASFGSSPHTWGIRLDGCPPVRQGWFIPTYVGHTLASPNATNATNGSSPHTWGIRAGICPFHASRRFIPTYVGHTCLSWNIAAVPAVHPHIRGAYCIVRLCSAANFGSSPHTWGILVSRISPTSGQRFIPTYVGHTKHDSTGNI